MCAVLAVAFGHARRCMYLRVGYAFSPQLRLFLGWLEQPHNAVKYRSVQGTSTCAPCTAACLNAYLLFVGVGSEILIALIIQCLSETCGDSLRRCFHSGFNIRGWFVVVNLFLLLPAGAASLQTVCDITSHFIPVMFLQLFSHSIVSIICLRHF